MLRPGSMWISGMAMPRASQPARTACATCGTPMSNQEAHTGGTADCQHKAVCDVCGQSYGELDASNHTGGTRWVQTAETHQAFYLCCGAAAGAEANHSWNDESVCTECGYGCAHTGGTATCKEKAICKNCNTPYGALDPHNHAALVKTEAKAATAQAEGNIAYWHCADCDKYFSDAAATTEIQKADTVTAKLQPASNGDKGEDPKSPETGDNVDPMRFVMLLLVSGGAVIVAACSRKRRETV